VKRKVVGFIKLNVPNLGPILESRWPPIRRCRLEPDPGLQCFPCRAASSCGRTWCSICRSRTAVTEKLDTRGRGTDVIFLKYLCQYLWRKKIGVSDPIWLDFDSQHIHTYSNFRRKVQIGFLEKLAKVAGKKWSQRRLQYVYVCMGLKWGIEKQIFSFCFIFGICVCTILTAV
jgi:hypothetical protein